jgi:glycosyltransferase involved in cell wall biosynthesis
MDRGLMDLLLAAEYLRPDRTIVFMGDGSLETELRSAADRLVAKNPAVRDRLRFVPKAKFDELPLWTAGSALGVLPIPRENVCLNYWFCTPNKLWEYPAAGVPVLVSPFPELTKIVTENEIGWFFPETITPRNIADSINRLELEELAATKPRCRAFILKDNWSLYGARLVEAFQRLSLNFEEDRIHNA